MKLNAYSVFDSKARAFLPPFFLHNDDVACRVFADCANDKTHQFGRHPTDFSLFRIGSFDDAVGELFFEAHFPLGLAASFVVNGGCDE